MHGHLCVVWWLFSSPVSFSSPFRCSSSRPSRRPPPRSTRSSCPKTCATSAWGPWPVMTTRHPSHREEDGSIQFYKIKFHLRDHHSQIQNWSDDRWKACLAAGGGSKRRYQYCSDNLGSIIYLRALQGHSGSNLIDPALQDNVLIGPGIFPYIYHVGSNFNLHSIVRNGLVPGGQNLSRRQTVFFLPVDPRNEDHKDPEHIDYSAPRLARYLQNAWKRHQDAVFLGRY